MAFKEPEEADTCQTTLNGRWFGGRKLSAELWDGVTDYQVKYLAYLKTSRFAVCNPFSFLNLIFSE